MQNDFNKIAPVYDFLASLIYGRAIKNSQTWLLQFIPENSNVLLVGGGTGWILSYFLQSTKCKSMVYLEASANMLELSRKQYLKVKKTSDCIVDFRLGTETNLLPTETFDVIFTGFLLDLFKPAPLQLLMQNLERKLNPGGLWLLADFAPENSTRFWQKALFKTMIGFFKVVSNLQANQLPDLKAAFQKFPLVPVQEKFYYRRLIKAVIYKKNVPE